MNVFELLVGKKMEIETDMKVMVELEIKSVEPKGHSREITPSTRDNDWWGETQTWDTYIVEFTNGSNKEFRNLTDIDVIV